jgi:hypothetical protein
LRNNRGPRFYRNIVFRYFHAPRNHKEERT